MKSDSLTNILALMLTVFFVDGATAFAADRLTCESQNGRRNYCEVGGARDADIELSRQISKSRCERGQTWGRDDRGVWVDNGCRAEFTVYRRQDSYGGRPHSGYRDREPSQHYASPAHEHYAPPVRESCPAGFESGSHRCTKDERRRGCKDMKMPGGTTCNSRGWAR